MRLAAIDLQGINKCRINNVGRNNAKRFSLSSSPLLEVELPTFALGLPTFALGLPTLALEIPTFAPELPTLAMTPPESAQWSAPAPASPIQAAYMMA